MRRFADAKIDEVRAELAAAAKSEAELKAWLLSGSRRFVEQVSSAQSSIYNADRVITRLLTEYAQCRESFNKAEAELTTPQISSVSLAHGVPQEVYEDF